MWFSVTQLIDQPVESRMQVVGDFSDSDTPIEREWGHVRLDAIDVIASLRITLGSDYVIWRILPNREHRIVKDLDFTFCTPYLEARSIQRCMS